MAYQRVNWQQGTKVSDPYVEVDGKRGTYTPGVYSGPTPCNPTSLNIMDEGIEENSKLLNGKLTVEEITLDKIELKNKFNKETVVEDSIIDLDGSVVSDKSGWCASDFISIKANTKYVYQGITNQGSEKYSAYYDSNKQFISYFTQETGFNKRITTPNGAHYVRFSMQSSDKENFQLELGEWSTEYTPYKELIDSDYIKGIKPMGSIVVEDIECKNILPNNTHTTNISDFYYEDILTGIKITSDMVDKGLTLSFDINILSINIKENANLYANVGYAPTPTAGMTDGMASETYTACGVGQQHKVITINKLPTESLNKYIVIRYIASNQQFSCNANITNIQLEKGEVATDYVEHKEFGYTNSDLLKNLFNIPNEKLRSTDNIDNFYNELGVKVYSIWDEIPIGMPSGVYEYGTLISITQSTKSMFLNMQIYITDGIYMATSSGSGNRGVYIRTGTQNWLRITGTTISKKTS